MATQSTNKVTLEGKLVEISHREDTLANGNKYVAGKVMIQTAEDNIIPVDFFQNEKKKDGGENSVYKGLMTFIKEARTIAKDGIEAADGVSVTTGQLGENSYYPVGAANLVRGFRIGSPFYRTKADAKEENSFVVSGIVLDMPEEIKDNVPTGTLFIDLLIIGYNNRGEVVRFSVEDPAGVSYIKNSTSKGDEVKLAGSILVRETREEKVEQTAFGGPIVEFITKTERKLLVTSATAAHASSVPESELTTMLSEREARLNEAKAKQEQKANGNKSASSPNRGFSL